MGQPNRAARLIRRNFAALRRLSRFASCVMLIQAIEQLCISLVCRVVEVGAVQLV